MLKVENKLRITKNLTQLRLGLLLFFGLDDLFSLINNPDNLKQIKEGRDFQRDFFKACWPCK